MSAINIGTCQEEINHLQTWAVENNLKLNGDKTKEIDFTASRKRAPPPPRPDIERVSSLRIFGVIINDRLSAADHVTMLLSSCSSLLSLTTTRCRILDPGNDDSVEPVRDASVARAWHSGHFTARHIQRYRRFPDPVCGTSVVVNVFG